MSLKLESKILMMNGKEGLEFNFIIAEAKSGQGLDIFMSTSRGNGFEINSAMLEEINAVCKEVYQMIELKKSDNPNRVSLVE